jgi:hypothetical protein
MSDGMSEADRKVLDVTFHSAGQSVNNAWGWKLPRNPTRRTGECTEPEMEVMRMAEAGTPQQREVSRVRTYTYRAPFNYPNVRVELGRPGTGVEFNMDGAELDIYPYGSITVEEREPIVGVTAIGSGCSGQGYVWMEAEPLEWKYPRTGVRMLRRDLWGIHVRFDAWRVTDESWNDAGLSSARFDIPESRKVILGGGSVGADPHYCFRIVRIDVAETIPDR